MKRKLAVFFPGRRYGVDCPLLYYAENVCRKKGYETLLMHYSEHRDVKDMITIEENVKAVLPYVKKRIRERDLGQYDEILFVSKSIGTVIAGWLEQELERERCLPMQEEEKGVSLDLPLIRHIFMTPLVQTFPYMESDKNIVICGSEDDYLDMEELRDFCKKHGIHRYCFEGVGHSMEHEKMKDTLKVMGEIMRIVKNFA